MLKLNFLWWGKMHMQNRGSSKLKTFSANKTFEYRSGKDIAYSAKKKCQQSAKPWNKK